MKDPEVHEIFKVHGLYKSVDGIYDAFNRVPVYWRESPAEHVPFPIYTNATDKGSFSGSETRIAGSTVNQGDASVYVGTDALGEIAGAELTNMIGMELVHEDDVPLKDKLNDKTLDALLISVLLDQYVTCCKILL